LIFLAKDLVIRKVLYNFARNGGTTTLLQGQGIILLRRVQGEKKKYKKTKNKHQRIHRMTKKLKESLP
jgi:hypothetical protein